MFLIQNFAFGDECLVEVQCSFLHTNVCCTYVCLKVHWIRLTVPEDIW